LQNAVSVITIDSLSPAGLKVCAQRPKRRLRKLCLVDLRQRLLAYLWAACGQGRGPKLIGGQLLSNKSLIAQIILGKFDRNISNRTALTERAILAPFHRYVV